MSVKKLSVAVVGLRFGAGFVPIYQNHPDVGEVILCEPDAERRNAVGDALGIHRRFADLTELLAAPDIDAVHLLTPVLLHADQAVQVLEAGKHCACAVVMGSSLDELSRVVEAERRSGKNYMMMETMVYSREFLFVKDMHERGAFGDLTFLRGTYLQDVEGYPEYWKTVPPMHYASHVVAPLLALADTRTLRVNCLGSGLLSPHLAQPGGNPFRLETALFRLENSAVAIEISRSWLETARPYDEAFSVYGTKRSFEWGQIFGGPHLLYTLEETPRPYGGRPVTVEHAEIPDYADRLPEPLRSFTHFETNGAHGGSHPHLVHEFVRSIMEDRPAAIDAVTAANWCAPGICAHLSALRDGETVTIPDFA